MHVLASIITSAASPQMPQKSEHFPLHTLRGVLEFLDQGFGYGGHDIRIGRPMALRQATAERGGSRGATAGTDRAGCGPIVEVPRCFLSTLKAGFISSARARLETALVAGRRHPGLLPLANLRFEVSRLLPAVCDESDVATTPRARNRKLLAHPGHEFGLWRREVSWEGGLARAVTADLSL